MSIDEAVCDSLLYYLKEMEELLQRLKRVSREIDNSTEYLILRAELSDIDTDLHLAIQDIERRKSEVEDNKAQLQKVDVRA